MKIPRFIRGKCDNIYFNLEINENIAYIFYLLSKTIDLHSYENQFA